MFSIAGMAEPPDSEAEVNPGTEPESSSSPLLQELHDMAKAAEAGRAASTQHEVADPIPAPPDPRVVTLSAPLATLLAAQYANAVEHMLLGKLQGRNHPSARDLTTWCKKHLHSTFLNVTFLGLGYFEVAFSSPDGKSDTLRRSGFYLGDLVVFSTWQPSFDPENPACVNTFPFAIWAQFEGLTSLLRSRECLAEIGKHIGTVVAVEDDESSRAQVAGPRVRMLVSTQDLNALPARVAIPQIGSYGGKTCKVVYSGLPDRCDVCETHAHTPQNCPMKAKFTESADNDEGSHEAEGTRAVKTPELKPLRTQRQTSVPSEDASSSVENALRDGPPSAGCTARHGLQHGKSPSSKAWTGLANAQYTMSLSGPLSAPHSPAHESLGPRCPTIAVLATKFSSRPQTTTSPHLTRA